VAKAVAGRRPIGTIEASPMRSQAQGTAREAKAIAGELRGSAQGGTLVVGGEGLVAG
jgi:hypothetical protein